MKQESVTRLREFIEVEARSCSMDPALITPEYIYRMWGGKVPIEEIEEAMKLRPTQKGRFLAIYRVV